MGKIVCFGELMLRLNPAGYLRFEQANAFEASFGGGEANVAVSLAHFGMNASFVSKFPKHSIGDMGIRALRVEDVDTKDIVRGGERMGIYYLEKGASQRASKVIYDRAYSSISMAARSDFDWNSILEGADWFHFTGITPALSDEVAEITLDALKVCKEKGVKVSCDLNFRKKLWTSEKAGKVMGELCKYVDVCIANEEDAEKVFGIKPDHNDVEGGKLNREGYIDVAKKLSDRFGCKRVAITLRTSISANDNIWAAMLYDKAENEYYFSRSYNIHIVDRVGGGDSFGGGLIYASLMNKSSQDVIEFAVAASCLKHTIIGDYNLVSVAEVEGLIKGGGSGRVQR